MLIIITITIVAVEGEEMAVQIDTSNNSLSAPSAYETQQNQSPSSNDSGFHGDSGSNDYENVQRRPKVSQKRSKKKETYVSVFAWEHDEPLYGGLTSRISKE